MISINLDKAKAIGHNIRRAKRASEFAPHDELLTKWIPGTSFEEVEAARALIRQKYEDIQNKIDLAQSADQIKSSLEI